MPQNLQNQIKVKINLPEFTPSNLHAVSYTVQLLRGNNIHKISEGTNIDTIPDEIYFASKEMVNGHLLRVIFTRASSMNNLEVSIDILDLSNGNIKLSPTTLQEPITILQHYFA